LVQLRGRVLQTHEQFRQITRSFAQGKILLLIADKIIQT
jgi:hypothetical protein